MSDKWDEKARGYTGIVPCVVKGEPDACNVFLTIGVQSFRVTSEPCETRDEAEWMRDMLTKAISAALREAAGEERERCIEIVLTVPVPGPTVEQLGKLDMTGASRDGYLFERGVHAAAQEAYKAITPEPPGEV